jgi:hypothetical protein
MVAVSEYPSEVIDIVLVSILLYTRITVLLFVSFDCCQSLLFSGSQNILTEDLLRRLEHIRAKFKQACKPTRAHA